MRFHKTMRTLLRYGMFLFAMLVGSGAMLYLYKEPEEWLGISRSHFDSEAPEYLQFPPDASRAFYYSTGFVDSATWAAFTASQFNIEKYISFNLHVDLAKLSDWPTGPPSSLPAASGDFVMFLPRPPRASWRNKGYWDVGASSVGKIANASDKGKAVSVFYDTVNSRLYFSVLEQ